MLPLNSTLSPQTASQGAEGGPQQQQPQGSFLDFSPGECRGVLASFAGLSVAGSAVQVFVLAVLGFKILSEPDKAASHLLMAYLTGIDLVACSVLFPLECVTFSNEDCNEPQSDLVFGLTFFLEVSSTLALLNIAIDRYLLVCWATSVRMTTRTSCYMCVGNLLAAVGVALGAVFSNQALINMIVYIFFILAIMLAMCALYARIYITLHNRAQRGKKTSTGEPQPTTVSCEKTRDTVGGAASPANGRQETKRGAEKSQMEKMMIRSAKIFVIITSVYIVCFLPNAILTIVYFVLGEQFLFAQPPKFAQIIIRYINLFYNLNFVLMPVVYATLNRQFPDHCRALLRRVQQLLGLDGGARSDSYSTPAVSRLQAAAHTDRLATSRC